MKWIISACALFLAWSGQCQGGFTFKDHAWVGQQLFIPYALTNGAVAHWRLDEASNLSRTDSISGLVLVDSLSDTPSAAGLITNAAGPFSTSGQLTNADNATISLGTNTDFTLLCWVKMPSPLFDGYATVMEKGNPATEAGNEYWLRWYGGYTNFIFTVGTTDIAERVVGDAPISSNQWYHLAGRYSSAAQKIYLNINATNEFSTNWTGGTFDSPDALSIGNAQGTGPGWTNLIDEVSIFKRFLSSNEVYRIYTNEKAGISYPWVSSGGGGGTFRYVDGGGNDAADGLTIGTAWLTLGHALTNLSPGNTLVLSPGQSFAENNLVLTTSGSNGSPIRITSNNTTNRATIRGVLGFGALTLDNVQYVQIDDLIFSAKTNDLPGLGTFGVITNCGIAVLNRTNVTLASVIITNSIITNANFGIAFYSATNTSGFTGASITGNAISNCIGVGLWVGTSNNIVNFALDSPNACFTGYIAQNEIGWILGAANGLPGTPMSINQAHDMTVENNYLHDSGTQCTASGGGGPGGFVLAQSSNVVFQLNEVSAIHKSTDNVDGVGADIDLANYGCTLRWNYIHDNYGYGLFHYGGVAAFTNKLNTFCFNLSIANERQFVAIGNVSYVNIFNNTLESTAGAPAVYFATIPTGTNVVANNLFWTTGNSVLTDYDLAATAFNGNDYYSENCASWAGNTYVELANFRTGANKEVGTGFRTDPLFYSSTVPGKIWPQSVTTITNQDLQAASPLRGTGLDLTPYGITIPSLDIKGRTTVSSNSVGAFNP